jgi:hypothetical protein
MEGRNRGMIPLCLRIRKQGADIVSLDVRRFRHVRQIAKDGVDTHKVNRTTADTAGLRQTWNRSDKDRPCRLLPQGELPPVRFLAEMPAVIAPETDDGVILIRPNWPV